MKSQQLFPPAIFKNYKQSKSSRKGDGLNKRNKNVSHEKPWRDKEKGVDATKKM